MRPHAFGPAQAGFGRARRVVPNRTIGPPARSIKAGASSRERRPGNAGARGAAATARHGNT
ncbi:hypothetical protein WJ39_24740 [Burkholderia diffusa]|nr:hypothetical protein WJ39_24740 [Burkholderia diffusa]